MGQQRKPRAGFGQGPPPDGGFGQGPPGGGFGKGPPGGGFFDSPPPSPQREKPSRTWLLFVMLGVGLLAAIGAGVGAYLALAPGRGESIAAEEEDVEETRRRTGGSASTSEPRPPTGKRKPVLVELYVMSQCPYSVKVLNVFQAVDADLGRDLDLRVDYVGKVDPSGSLSSMHGPAEVTGDIAQLCVNKLAPKRFLDVVACQNSNFRHVDSNWEPCATQHSVPVDKLRKCVEGPDGKALLTASFERAQQRGARASPTIFVGGQKYTGQRTKDAFLRAICRHFDAGNRPAACKGVEELPQVLVTILSDRRCEDCKPERLVKMVKGRIGNPVVTEVDYGDAAGRALYDDVGGGGLPMAIFDASLARDVDATQQLSGHLEPAGGGRKKMSYRPKYNPRCADDGGCQLSECSNSLVCRKEKPRSLELFVMSQCPFGVKALNVMPGVLKDFGGQLDFSLHYVATGTAADGFKALHGKDEVDENIRQLCAAHSYRPNHKYLDYILCRNKDIRSTQWQSCTGANGIATQRIQSCFGGAQGKQLLEKDIQIGNALGITASPNWVVNGRHKFSGLTAEVIRRNVCKHNPSMRGCTL